MKILNFCSIEHYSHPSIWILLLLHFLMILIMNPELPNLWLIEFCEYIMIWNLYLKLKNKIPIICVITNPYKNFSILFVFYTYFIAHINFVAFFLSYFHHNFLHFFKSHIAILLIQFPFIISCNCCLNSSACKWDVATMQVRGSRVRGSQVKGQYGSGGERVKGRGQREG